MALRSFAIVPAAGRSVRMGSAKLLLPWRGQTIIEAVLSAWQRSGVSHVVVVVHPDDQQLADVCRHSGADVQAAFPPPPDMKASVRHGLRHVAETYHPTDTDVWLLAPADMPLLSANVIAHVLAAWPAPEGKPIVAPRCGTKRGHPVLFSWRLAAEVEQLADTEGVNQLLARHGVHEIEIVDSAAFADIDTPDDYHRLHKPHSRE